MDKNLPANAGGHGFDPCSGKIPHVAEQLKSNGPQLMSLPSTSTEAGMSQSPHAATTDAHVPRACAPQQEKSPQCKAHALQGREAPCSRN